MRKDWTTPAVPTIQVRRRKRITPNMFCRHGRYTPISVPIFGDYREKNSKEKSLSEFFFYFILVRVIFFLHFFNNLGHLFPGCISTFCLFMFFGSLSNICVIDQPAEERRDLWPDVQLFLWKHTPQYHKMYSRILHKCFHY